MVRWSVTVILGVVVLFVTQATPVVTQSTSPESALLTEVRLLRQAIEALAGNGSRIQLVFGRLQLQEQRTTSAVRRLEDVRSALANFTMRLSEVNDRLKELEAAAGDARHLPEEQEAVQQQLAQVKRESARMEAERSRLAAEEAEAANVVNLEQGRWADLNRQVEEFERLLIQRR